MAGNYDRTYPVGIFSLNQYITYKLMFNFLKQEIMKKLLLLAPIAVLALASCSNDEQIAQSPALNAQEVTFRPVVNGTTRTITTDANFTGFTVEASITNGGTYAFWKGVDATVPSAAPTAEGSVKNSLTLPVTKDPTSGKWELLDGARWYWSSKNAEASFIGYTEKGEVSVAEDVASQKDVLVAYNKGAASSFDNGVPMLFRHVLSQIVVKADNKDADIRQIKVAAVRFHNFGKTNTLTLPSSETTADNFKWYDATSATDGYKPWAGNPTTQSEKWTYYKNVVDNTAKYAGAGDAITLNASAQEITFKGAVLMLPQTNAAAASSDFVQTGTNTANPNANGKAYIDVLIQVQAIGTAANTTDTWKNAIYPTIASTETTLTNQLFAWVAVPVEFDWKPGYKYTYVLHFSENGIGKISPDTTGGDDDPDPGHEPGEDVVDNPVPLYFTVTIDEWNDAAKIEKDL